MLKLKNVKKTYAINVPTNIDELTPELLAQLVSFIKVPPYYAIVCLVGKLKLSEVATNVNNNKGDVQMVIPKLAYISKEDSDKVKAVVGDTIVVDRTTLERGHHVHVDTVLDSTAVKMYLRGDEELRKNLMAGGDGTPIVEDPKHKHLPTKEKDALKLTKSPEIFTVQFKVIPVVDIHSSYSKNRLDIDPFKVVESTEVIN